METWDLEIIFPPCLRFRHLNFLWLLHHIPCSPFPCGSTFVSLYLCPNMSVGALSLPSFHHSLPNPGITVFASRLNSGPCVSHIVMFSQQVLQLFTGTLEPLWTGDQGRSRMETGEHIYLKKNYEHSRDCRSDELKQTSLGGLEFLQIPLIIPDSVQESWVTLATQRSSEMLPQSRCNSNLTKWVVHSRGPVLVVFLMLSKQKKAWGVNGSHSNG